MPIGHLRFERVIATPGRPSAPTFAAHNTGAHLNDPDDDLDTIVDAEEPDHIKVRVASADWPKGFPNASVHTDPKGRVVKLHIPETLPDPNSMHIFVQFQVSILTFLKPAASPTVV